MPSDWTVCPVPADHQRDAWIGAQVGVFARGRACVEDDVERFGHGDADHGGLRRGFRGPLLKSPRGDARAEIDRVLPASRKLLLFPPTAAPGRAAGGARGRGQRLLASHGDVDIRLSPSIAKTSRGEREESRACGCATPCAARPLHSLGSESTLNTTL